MENKMVLYGDGIGIAITENSAPEKIWSKTAELCRKLLARLPENAEHVMETEILMAADDPSDFGSCTCHLVAYACAEGEEVEQEDYDVVPGVEIYKDVKAFVMESLEGKLFPK